MKPRRRVHPREEHVAELTRGLKLPLEPLHQIHLMLIAQALVRTWNDLLEDRRSILLSRGETEVNALMEIRLNALRDEDELWTQLVRVVSRGSEMISHDGSHLEKQPDLSIHLTNRSPFPLIVECKLIDAPSRKTVDLYCKKGLLRFVKGEYAWASREAFMLAYVRDRSTIFSCLAPFLTESQGKPSDVYLTEVIPQAIDEADMHLARSSHNREFRYLVQSPNSPGAIAIWHLWIDASQQ